MRKTLFFLPALIMFVSCNNKLNKTKASIAPVNNKTIDFSGYTWVVSDATRPAAPGPNFWDDANVWVDAAGHLHLKITKDANGIWHCAELRTTYSLAAGTYELQVEGNLETLDRNIVFGMFNYSGRDHRDEIDIEVSRWGSIDGDNLHYNVYPRKGKTKWSASGVMKLNGSYSTHIFKRSATAVSFQSLHGFDTAVSRNILSASCDNPAIISTRPMPLYINLWLFNGAAPINGQETEIIIHRFRFTP